MYSVGRLAKQVGLSRSTLLYYDKIKLLTPSGRSGHGYRLYSEADKQRLMQICQYRESGLALSEIAALLDAKHNKTGQILQDQYQRLTNQISALKGQQNKILAMLGQPQLLEQKFAMTKAQWTDILSACGMSDEDMWQWHKEFEVAQPEAHEAFLKSLSIPSKEIAEIRSRSKVKAIVKGREP